MRPPRDDCAHATSGSAASAGEFGGAVGGAFEVGERDVLEIENSTHAGRKIIPRRVFDEQQDEGRRAGETAVDILLLGLPELEPCALCAALDSRRCWSLMGEAKREPSYGGIITK